VSRKVNPYLLSGSTSRGAREITPMSAFNTDRRNWTAFQQAKILQAICALLQYNAPFAVIDSYIFIIGTLFANCGAACNLEVCLVKLLNFRNSKEQRDHGKSKTSHRIV
jgi:predicted Zn-dependent protease